ncbi:acetyl-CoA carboxylase biotin carboxyl carrier protein [Paraburkholderia lacunae]|nr:acetyl-CoA carboxylase biotin carboxyl carrier protein subunit [Paraburkholderia lacunae]
MFGVVHLTPAPGEAPFVNPGGTIEEGQVLCTIEAMKMFNAIESEFGGAVLEILVTPGSEVESGQPLFRIG